VRPVVRFLLGLSLGGGTLLAYLWFVGPGAVLDRATAVAGWALWLVVALVVAEAVADGVGMWASVRPLGDGFSPRQSVQFALAGDFMDTVSPAGPVTSEPIMAQFISTETATGYSEALGVRGVAKYVKAGTQLLFSSLLLGLLFLLGVAPRFVLFTLGGAVVVLVVVGLLLLVARGALSELLVAVLTPVVAVLTRLFGLSGQSRERVAEGVERFWSRVLAFRETPELLVLIAAGGLLEQVLTAAALYVALAGTGTTVALVPIVAIVPLPQAASVLPVPASIGAYDLLLAGALVVMTGTPAADATAAVLVVRTFGVGVSLAGGGVATGFLRGWRPGWT
jgi:uncharacterized membrane protein YbhN (UPF0104 family)